MKDLSLRDFDAAGFAAALLDPDLPVPDGIAETDGAPRQDRFAIYRNNVVQGLIEALETGFPAVRQCVGTAFFAAAATRFATRHPPRAPIMASYGDEFPDFLADFEPCAPYPYLADLARLELARTGAYHAEDAAPLSQEAFASLAPDDLADLRLTLHPSLHILASPYPIATIFAMTMGELPPAAIEDWQGEDILVVRPQLTVEMRRLPQGGAVFLSRLSAGAPLGEAADAAFTAAEKFDLAANLAGLIGFGLVIEISPPPRSIQ